MLMRICRFLSTHIIAVMRAGIILACCTSFAFGQVSPEEHRKHHPQKTGGSGSRRKDGGMMGGPGGAMMDEMMRKMGAPKPKQMYPRLMDLPDLPLEKRDEIKREAHQRMVEGTKMLSEGFDELSRSAETDDFAAMQKATAKVREGLARFESGLAAHRAIAEGKAPRSVALQWFKREMNLLPPATEPQQASGLWGMSPFHTAIMVSLILFAGLVTWMYFFKMRRATELMRRLSTAEAAVPPTETNDVPAYTSTAASSKSVSKNSQLKTETERPATDDSCCTEETGGICASDFAETESSGGLLPLATKRKLCKLRVARIDQETPDVKTFRLVACHGGGIPFSYLPGQFLTLTLPVGEKPIRRSYTISSSPTQGYYCEITVKREEHGFGSRYLHGEIKVGDTIEVQAPSGKFFFAGKEADSIVLIAGGVGITPMMSVTRALTDMAWEGEIFFIVACHDPEHFIFESELKRLQARHENLHVFAAMSRIEQDVDGYWKGRLSRELLAEWVPEIASRRIHLCGPPAMMDAVKKMLAELDVPADSIHTENFGGEQKPRVRAEQRAKVADTDVAETGGTVTFTRSDKSAELLPDETILEASERVGVEIEYSCRVGMCGVCTVKLLSGEVTMEVDDGLESDDREEGVILACQAKSTGDVTVEA